MTEATPSGRTRDADRTREAILDAAEALFAERGYAATSLQAIGERAGISRGTPGYFFRSKAALYRAVLERVFAAELAFVVEAQAAAPLAEAGAHPLEAAIGALLDFLAARPSFVRLLEREALAGGETLRATAAHATAMREGLAIVTALLGQTPDPVAGPAEVLLSVLALCWFPFAHAATFARDLGIDPHTEAGRARWRRHVTGLMLHGISAGR